MIDVFGKYDVIDSSFKAGKNCTIGNFVTIEPGVIVGDNCQIGNYVLLKSGTKIGDDCQVDSYVRSSGDNRIGNNCTLRYGATIARRVQLGDGVFLSPNVMTIFGREVTVIEDGVFVGTGAVIDAGVWVTKGVRIGALAFVREDCTVPGATYVGVPARRRK